MADDTNIVTVPKMTRLEAVQKAKDLLHLEGVPHENKNLFEMSLSLVMLAWRHLGLIEE